MTFFIVVEICDLRYNFYTSTINIISKDKIIVDLVLLLFLYFIKALILFLSFQTFLLEILLLLLDKNLNGFTISKDFLIKLLQKT